MQLSHINDIPLFSFEKFPDTGLFHFVTTIHGGAGKGAYHAFNLGAYCGDSVYTVAENRRLLAEVLEIGVEDIFVPYQTHGDKVCIIDEEFMSLPEAERIDRLNGVDALITGIKNICIGITTADCVPVLVFDPKKRVFAAIHAGWRGTVISIVEKTISYMVEYFDVDPSGLMAGIGPAISFDKFEVGDEVGKVFEDKGYDLSGISYRKKVTGKIHIDLKEANRLQLLNSNILFENIEVSDLCTFSEQGQFFSARRQGVHSGRMLTGGILY